MKIIKKTLELEDYSFDKIVRAIGKSANRVNESFTETELNQISDYVESEMAKYTDCDIPVATMHTIVECALDKVKPNVAKAYRDFRNYKQEYSVIMDEIYQASKDIRYIADKDNANTDSTLVSTQRSLLLKKLSKELYQKFQLTAQERADIKDGYYYIHDLGDRLFTGNCCLFDMGAVLKDGFEMANMTYNEPNSLQSAMNVISDVALSAASQQYGM